MKGGNSIRDLARRSAAEFVVIVLGVLVALAGDDWRQRVHDRQLEQIALAQVANDLALDAQDLKGAAAVASNRATAGIRLLERLGESPDVLGELRDSFGRSIDSLSAGLRTEGADSVGQEALALTRTQVFDPTRSAFTSLLSSGDLGLITDEETRWALVAYYGYVDAMLEIQPRYRERQNEYVQHLARLGLTAWDLTVRPGQLARLRADPSFRTEVLTLLSSTSHQLGILRDIEDRRAALQQLVQSRLVNQ